MSAHLSRRSLLGAVPAVGLAGFMVGATPVGAETEAETPIAQMHREITRLQTVLNDRNNGIPDDMADAMCDRMMELAGDIVDLPCQSPMDLLKKIAGHTVNGDHDLGNCPSGEVIWAEVRAIVAA